MPERGWEIGTETKQCIQHACCQNGLVLACEIEAAGSLLPDKIIISFGPGATAPSDLHVALRCSICHKHRRKGHVYLLQVYVLLSRRTLRPS